MNFTIFAGNKDFAALNAALAGIPRSIPIRVLADYTVAEGDFIRPCDSFVMKTRTTWVQKFRLAMLWAHKSGYKWAGYAHDDGEISLEDCIKLAKAAEDAPANVFQIYTQCPGVDCRDVYSLLNVEHYWTVGGHDEWFDFYWADIDLYNRQIAAGLVPLTIECPSIKHSKSRVHREATGAERVARDLIFAKDKAYYQYKYPNEII